MDNHVKHYIPNYNTMQPITLKTFLYTQLTSNLKVGTVSSNQHEVIDMNYSITKNGICAEHLCVIDETNKTVSTQEDGLVFDFSNEYGWSFKTGSDCTFNTGSSCTFNTGSDCTFKTGPSCTFKTGSDCTFNAGPSCTFNTCSDCIFKVRDNCALIRWDVKGVTALPTDITIKLNEYGIAGYLANTKEWVKQNMDNEEGLAIILANDEYFDPLLLNI